MDPPPFHLCLVQPLGVTDSLTLLEPMLALGCLLERRGHRVTRAKNRLVHAAVNLVLGAEHEFDPALLDRHACVIVDAGTGAATAEYLELLRAAPVAAYAGTRAAALAGAIVLDWPTDGDGPARPRAARAFDVALFGGANEPRRLLAIALARSGLRVAAPEAPVYGPERDAVLRDAGLVVLCGSFDAALVARALALGTPCAIHGAGPPDPYWAARVQAAPDAASIAAIARDASRAAAGLSRCREGANEDGVDALVERASAHHARCVARRDRTPWRPARINVGSGRDYLMGWLNLDVLAEAQPDALLDLAQPLALPLELESRFAGPVRLEAGSVDLVFASNVLEHVPDLVAFVTQVLALLRVGGDFLVEVPYEHAPEAWQDPTHVRAMNEASWKYFTSWFWYLDWFEHRFDLVDHQYLDERLEPCAREHARFMRAVLRKIETTPAERTQARAARPDAGGLWPLLHPDPAHD